MIVKGYIKTLEYRTTVPLLLQNIQPERHGLAPTGLQAKSIESDPALKDAIMVPYQSEQ